MPSSAPAPERVRDRFREKALQFDDLYEDERPLTRWLRPGLFRRRELATETIAGYRSPRVLDVGCGSGRIGELALQAGAAHYVGVDFSEPMIALAGARLQRFGDRAQLILGDFAKESIDGASARSAGATTGPAAGATAGAIAGPFEVVLALGLFDYLSEPHVFARRMFAACAAGGCLVASFPSFSPIKGPVRKVRYEWIGDCPIFNYTRRELELLLCASGFEPVEIFRPGRSGHLVRAHRPAR